AKPPEGAEEELEEARLGAPARRRIDAVVPTARELREKPRELATTRAEDTLERFSVKLPGHGAERRDHGTVGELPAVEPDAVAPQHDRVVRRPGGELADEARLADPCLAGDDHDPGLAGRRGAHRLLGGGEAVVPADHRGTREPVSHGAIVPGRRGGE